MAASCGSAAVVTPAPAPTPTVAPPSARALQAASSASQRTSSTSAAASLNLAAARVLGASAVPVLGSGVFDFAAGRGPCRAEPTRRHRDRGLRAGFGLRAPGRHRRERPAPGKDVDLRRSHRDREAEHRFPQFVAQAEGVNPGFLLDQVAWGAVSAAPLARRVVDGSPVSGYLVGVDLRRAGNPRPRPRRCCLRTRHRVRSGCPGRRRSWSVPPIQQFRVWIDGTGHVVQLQASPPDSGVGVTTVTFSSFGAEVQVRVPPSSQTANVASLTPGGERENNGGGDADGA